MAFWVLPTVTGTIPGTWSANRRLSINGLVGDQGIDVPQTDFWTMSITRFDYWSMCEINLRAS